jgi:hypothetical protein
MTIEKEPDPIPPTDPTEDEPEEKDTESAGDGDVADAGSAA